MIFSLAHRSNHDAVVINPGRINTLCRSPYQLPAFFENPDLVGLDVEKTRLGFKFDFDAIRSAPISADLQKEEGALVEIDQPNFLSISFFSAHPVYQVGRFAILVLKQNINWHQTLVGAEPNIEGIFSCGPSVRSVENDCFRGINRCVLVKIYLFTETHLCRAEAGTARPPDILPLSSNFRILTLRNSERAKAQYYRQKGGSCRRPISKRSQDVSDVLCAIHDEQFSRSMRGRLQQEMEVAV